MATITMVFPDPLNVSLQIGDTAYYVPTNTHGGFLTSLNSGGTAEETIVEIGSVASITQNTNTITVTTSLTTANLPTTSHYIFFSKDNKANLSTILGYYAEVKFSNNSTTEAELFSIGADIFESSK
jgi:hypothetical protein